MFRESAWFSSSAWLKIKVSSRTAKDMLWFLFNSLDETKGEMIIVQRRIVQEINGKVTN